MTTTPLRPARGGFLRAFGCGQFIREYLLGRAPQGAPQIDSDEGAPQADIFYEYKSALLRATALDRATRTEEQQARREGRAISPEEIERLTERILARLPYRTRYARYHSFLMYFSQLRRLGWVEPTGREEPSAFQTNYPAGPPRRWYRLTSRGRRAGLVAWTNPKAALYPMEELVAPPTPPPAAPAVPERARRRAAPPAPPPPTPPPPVSAPGFRVGPAAQARDYWDEHLEANPLRTGRHDTDAGAFLSLMIESAGDILRERGKEQPDRAYIQEKVNRIRHSLTGKRDWTDPLSPGEMQRLDLTKKLLEGLPAPTADTMVVKALLISITNRDVEAIRRGLSNVEGLVPPPPPSAAAAAPPTEIPAFTVAPKPSRGAAQRLIVHLRKVEEVGLARPEVKAELERLAGEVSGWAELVGEDRDKEEAKEEPNEDRLDTLQDRLEALESVAEQLEAGDVADAIGTLDDAWPPPATRRRRAAPSAPPPAAASAG